MFVQATMTVETADDTKIFTARYSYQSDYDIGECVGECSRTSPKERYRYHTR